MKDTYKYETILARSREPERFIRECEAEYDNKVALAAETIMSRLKRAPVVLLAGPSGSGKTTMARKLCEKITSYGTECRYVSMDDYYLDVNPDTHPRDERGNIDFESPYCLDIPLFLEHIETLRAGGTIGLPCFDFAGQRRVREVANSLSISGGGLCIFEGIHALNPMFFKGFEDCTQRVYVSARSDIVRGGAGGEPSVLIKATWTRLVRRMVRDGKFRNYSPEQTMRIWATIRAGEKKYISPYHPTANMAIDTHLRYEDCVLRKYTQNLNVPDVPRAAEMRGIAPAYAELPEIPEDSVPQHSPLREFIGGNEQ